MGKRVPVVSGLFSDGPNGPRLLGSRCAGCGHYYFPVSGDCRNPACDDRRIEQVELSARGRLWSYSVQHYPPPPPFRFDPPFHPFGIGLVELDGLKVLGMLQVDNPDGLLIGSEMEVTLDRMYAEDGNDVVTWKFKPIAGGDPQASPR